MSFEYNSAWGDPNLAQYNQKSQVLKINFAENVHLHSMVMSSNFYDGVVEDGRGGSLTLDSLSFVKDEQYIEHYFESVERQKANWIEYEYITSQLGHCGY